MENSSVTSGRANGVRPISPLIEYNSVVVSTSVNGRLSNVGWPADQWLGRLDVQLRHQKNENRLYITNSWGVNFTLRIHYRCSIRILCCNVSCRESYVQNDNRSRRMDFFCFHNFPQQGRRGRSNGFHFWSRLPSNRFEPVHKHQIGGNRDARRDSVHKDWTTIEGTRHVAKARRSWIRETRGAKTVIGTRPSARPRQNGASTRIFCRVLAAKEADDFRCKILSTRIRSPLVYRCRWVDGHFSFRADRPGPTPFRQVDEKFSGAFST